MDNHSFAKGSRHSEKAGTRTRCYLPPLRLQVKTRNSESALGTAICGYDAKQSLGFLCSVAAAEPTVLQQAGAGHFLDVVAGHYACAVGAAYKHQYATVNDNIAFGQ